MRIQWTAGESFKKKKGGGRKGERVEGQRMPNMIESLWEKRETDRQTEVCENKG